MRILGITFLVTLCTCSLACGRAGESGRPKNDGVMLVQLGDRGDVGIIDSRTREIIIYPLDRLRDISVAYAALSPDRSLFAFSTIGEVGIVSRDGEITFLAGSSAGGYGARSRPAWSPQGDRLLFARSVRAGWELCVYDLNAKATSVVLSLRDISLDRPSFLWLSDGKTVLVCGKLAELPDDNRTEWGLYSLELGTEASPRLIYSGDDTVPLWAVSPDQKEVWLFGVWTGYDHQPPPLGIQRIPLKPAEPVPAFPLPFTPVAISVSPTNALVALADWSGDSLECVVYDTKSGNLKRLGATYEIRQDWDLHWSPDGRYLTSGHSYEETRIWDIRSQNVKGLGEFVFPGFVYEGYGNVDVTSLASCDSLLSKNRWKLKYAERFMPELQARASMSPTQANEYAIRNGVSLIVFMARGMYDWR